MVVIHSECGGPVHKADLLSVRIRAEHLLKFATCRSIHDGRK